ncbi:gliding motility protein GldN [Parasediminibacterium sp. JCM 36343]|uniref:type IX secretion system ring protein PorN/GldN n=1 Tax=Parasediminibacterium sp. JCM 36343 TaxID=3374279 RepID=UPI00397CB078
MKKFLLVLSLVWLSSVSFNNMLYAQKGKKKPVRAAAATRSSKKPKKGVTSNSQDSQPKAPETSNTGSNIPLEIASNKGSGGGINDSAKVSLRNDNAIERNLVKDRAPLTYKKIREDDAVYKQRIWREIDTREKINLPFRYSLIENNGSQRFISILINAIKSGVVAFDANFDDRFTTPLTTEQALAKFSGGQKADTIDIKDMEGNVIKRKVVNKEPDLDSIYKYVIKEEVVFDKESSRLFTRILGIAPMMPLTTSEGTSLGQMVKLFWLYYPDLRETLAKYEVYNPKNFGARMSWEDLFEQRMFGSYITKTTMDNPFDQSLKEKYGKNSLFVLLEGEAIKEKIFNYEQDLWSY